eukprot:scaffold123670_cov75-Phaeocystis_antarctica.AAC.1
MVPSEVWPANHRGPASSGGRRARLQKSRGGPGGARGWWLGLRLGRAVHMGFGPPGSLDLREFGEAVASVVAIKVAIASKSSWPALAVSRSGLAIEGEAARGACGMRMVVGVLKRPNGLVGCLGDDGHLVRGRAGGRARAR